LRKSNKKKKLSESPKIRSTGISRQGFVFERLEEKIKPRNCYDELETISFSRQNKIQQILFLRVSCQPANFNTSLSEIQESP